MAVQLRVSWIFVVLSLQYVQPLSLLPPSEVYMNQECGSSLEVSGSFLLRLRNKDPSSKVPETCGLDLEVMPRYRFNIRITSLNIPSPSYPVCRNYLEISDGSSEDVGRKSMTSRLCNSSSFPKGLIRSEGRFVFLWFESVSQDERSVFEIIISPFLDQVDDRDPLDNAVYISIAVATSVLLLAVIVGMCCCVYSNRKKEIQRRRRRMRRQNTIQMTLEVVGGLDNPAGPPIPPPDPTPPAYSPATAPPAYSTLPRRQRSKEGPDAKPEEEPYSPEVAANSEEVTQNLPEDPPAYEEHCL